MQTPRERIYIALGERLPNIKASTLNSYTSVIKSILSYIYDRGGVAPETIDLTILKNPKLIQDYVDEYEKKNGKVMPETTRRNIYSLLYRIFPDMDEFKNKFAEAVKDIQSRDPQIKSEREEDNWLSKEEVEKVYQKEWNKVRPILKILKSKTAMSAAILTELSNFILLAVSSGVFIPPRRSTDWTEMKIKNYSPIDNYYNAGKFHFNNYKTAGVYGEQIVTVPRKLRDILKMYIEKNPYDYLLVNNFGGKLVESSLPPRLNKIFGGKKISTTMLRHIYLSDYHKDTPNLEDMKKTAHDMGHSIAMGLEYVRR